MDHNVQPKHTIHNKVENLQGSWKACQEDEIPKTTNNYQGLAELHEKGLNSFQWQLCQCNASGTLKTE